MVVGSRRVLGIYRVRKPGRRHCGSVIIHGKLNVFAPFWSTDITIVAAYGTTAVL
jgi:hypothetical protein